MAVDNYPDEEGYIDDGLVIGFCKAVGTIVQNQAVELGLTSVSGYVSVLPSVSTGEAYAVALAAAATDALVPVCFHGVVKMYGGDTITAGDVVCNDTSGIFVKNLVQDCANATEIAYFGIFKVGGTVRYMGLALQNSNTTGGELLVLIGGHR